MPTAPEHGPEATAAPPRASRRERSRLREGLEGLIAVSAFLVSLASIAIAYQENRASKQLVQASSLPYLSFSNTFNYVENSDRGSTAEVVRAVINNGVGPADVRYATIRFKGRNYGDGGELLRDCCGVAKPHTTATLTNQMIRAGSAVTYLDVQGKASEHAKVDRYAELLSSGAIKTIICYCSVFNDCWSLESNGNGRPAPVRECPIVQRSESTL